ncbi:MAG: alkene reductase [Chitinophagaceae bacterium]|nr:alkene reductase [Chitinophagaceae bacterium]
MVQKLFSERSLGTVVLSNSVVMAPMTRCRAIGNIPNALIAEYYGQRATAGLIITEGTSPSVNGTGYARIPGIYTKEQVEGWKLTTKAVHDKGGRIFVQLMHSGRISHPLNLVEGTEILAPSAVQPAGEMYTDAQGMQPFPVPKAMTAEDIRKAKQEFVQAAKNALEAGFDGVELHAANGYLIEQFLALNTNLRTDEYGGSDENRSRFLVEVVQEVVVAIGKDRVGVRLSPYGNASDIVTYSEEQAEYFAGKLSEAGIAYIHLADHSSMGAPEVKPSVVKKIRNAFKGTLIRCGGYDGHRAEQDLESGVADLIAFGRPFVANPDLVERLKTGAELKQPDFNTFYTADEKGFTDYPTLATKGVMQ